MNLVNPGGGGGWGEAGNGNKMELETETGTGMGTKLVVLTRFTCCVAFISRHPNLIVCFANLSSFPVLCRPHYFYIGKVLGMATVD